MPTIKTGYASREQFKPFHRRAERFACIVAHRRAGKTVACVNDLIDGALRCDRSQPRFAYIAPYYKQAKDVAWTYAKDYTAPIPGTVANESELRVDLPNGGRVRLYGADNPDALRGIYLDGVILDEYADMSPRLWGEVIRPALSDRKGWAVFIGTPKGRNAFHDVYERAKADPNWFALMLRSSETGIVDPDELALARLDMTPEQYEQEYECSFDAAIMGAYFGKEVAEAERAGRVASVAYEPDLPVHTAWDLGIGDSTAIWCFQVAHDGVRVIDYYENHGYPVGHYVGVLNEKPYRYGTDYVPHDARVKSWGTGRTRIEDMTALNRKPVIVPQHGLDDGINAARLTIPRCVFDAVKCRDGLECLRQYRRDFDEKLNTFKPTPRHDWTSHGADAFRYLAMAWRAMVPEKPKDTAPAKGVLSLPIAELIKRQASAQTGPQYGKR